MTTTLRAAPPPRAAGSAPPRRGATVMLLAAAGAAFVVSMTVGRYPLPPADVLAALAGRADPATTLVVLELRLPRALTGLVVGAVLALAGALTQSFTRNPLASPDLIGITGGASAGAVGAIVLGGGTYALAPGWAEVGVPVAAAVGAVVAAAAVFGFAWRGDLPPERVVLVGIGVAAIGTALVSWLLVAASIGQAGQAAVWLTGSLNGSSAAELGPLLGAAAVLVPAALLLRRPLAALALGDDVARTLGSRLRTVQSAAVVLSALLTATAVAAAGPVQFVAVVAPQIAVRVLGRADIPLVASAATGAALVTAADVVGRSVLDFEIPVGLVTAAIGAPYLIGLLARRRSTA